MDDIERRESMEASENTPNLQRHAGTALHRIDPARVSETLFSGRNAAGFARLELMVGTIFDRLVAGQGENRG